MPGLRHTAECWVLAAAGPLALALAWAVLRLTAGDPPQRAGEDVLALLFGDARQQVSAAFYDKVEEYFHGGVRQAECDHGLVSGTVWEPESGDAEEHENHEEGCGCAADPALLSHGLDPWVWLNARIHAQAHRHLEEGRAVELLPWVWAACRASPKNTQAFLSGSYVLARMVGRPEEGARLLEQGIAHNPSCAELEFALGELYLNRLHDPARAEPRFRAAVKKCRVASKPEGEGERRLLVQSLFYLGHLAHRRGDIAQLRECVRAAEAAEPEYICTLNLRALLKAAEGP